MPRTSSSVASSATALQASCRARSSPHRSDRIRPWRLCVADPLQDRSARLAGERHQPAVAERDRALALRSHRRCSTMATSSSPSRHQPAVAGRIGRPKSQHRDRRAVASAARSIASVCGRISGVSAKITRISSAPRSMRLARASTAWAVPRRSPARRSAPRRERARLGRDSVVIGPDHDGDFAAARCVAAPPAHARAASGPPPRAAPSAAPTACACLRRPRARSQGRFVAASFFRSRNCHPNGARQGSIGPAGERLRAYPVASRNESEHCRILLTFSMT